MLPAVLLWQQLSAWAAVSAWPVFCFAKAEKGLQKRLGKQVRDRLQQLARYVTW